jgi:CheY-like chemotaxis protein
MNILVIEDEPASRKLANLVLSSDGHQVIESHSAEHAMKSVLNSSPEIILLDLALPGMDGYALTRRLKADPQTRHIPIIAVTSYPERFTREEAFRAGCDSYIVKPIDTRKLSHQVTTIAAHKSMRSK